MLCRRLELKACATAIVLAVCVVAPPVGTGTVDLGQARPAIQAPLAARSLLLDAARAGERIVAVGERGHVLVSDDEGRGWVQRAIPVRATLTGVYFHDAELGWAVGHDAVILRSRDGGDSWEPVYYAPDEERPLLDVWFRDERHGLAVGAYGFYLVTDDAGDSWTSRDVIEEDAEVDEFYGGGIEYHLNRLRAAVGGRLYVAAEAGTVLRSDDGGRSWVTLPSPYGGSFFGVLPLEGESLLVFGLRGHLYRSDDGGRAWDEIPTGSDAMLTDGIRLRDGRLVVVGLAGTLLWSDDDGRSFALEERPDRLGISAVLETADGGLLLVGDAGALRVEPETIGAGPAQAVSP